MTTQLYRYQIEPHVQFAEAKDSLILALVAVECLHGSAGVRLEATYSIDEDRRSCVIDGSTTPGRDLAYIFAGFLTKEFGEDAFTVEKPRRDNAPNNTRKVPS